LADTLLLQRSEVDVALLALESEGFVLRGKFHPQTTEQEWCDRRLLARIHRVTIDRLRTEIQPVSVQDFYRFLFAWQRADHESRVEGLDGLQSVLEQLDGYDLPLAAWESAVLPARVSDYDPEWLDRLCFSGRVSWGRLSTAQNSNARVSGPLRTSPIALYQREDLQDWLILAHANPAIDLSATNRALFDAMQSGGALFFTELVRRSGLLPSQVEDALSQLAGLGLVTSDSFDGLRALLVPSNKRPTFGRKITTGRRRANLASIEFAGRWSLLRTQLGANGDSAGRFAHDTANSAENSGRYNSVNGAGPRDTAIEKFGRVLLRRYGIIFRRLLERESLPVGWYELGRVYRRWEARGEIRGGYFVGGISGEQFALPEAIGLFRDALPVAALEGGEIRKLSDNNIPDLQIETALRIGKLRPSLRPYYK
jgi:ATP-dependent Lhr-like helicase